MNLLQRSTLVSIALILTTAFSATAQSMTEWKDLHVNEVNRLPIHTSLFPFESEQAAQKGMEYSRRYLSIHGDWQFHWVANADDPQPDDFFSPLFNDSTWGTMPVPGMWELNGVGAPVYVNSGFAWHGQYKNNPPIPPMQKNHVGFYRRTISVPQSWLPVQNKPMKSGKRRKDATTTKGDKQVILHLGSVTSCVYVWVNGKYVGYSEDSKIAAEFDITPHLNATADNLIAMKVYRWCDGSYCEDQDFWRLTGIARESYLYCRDAAVHVDNMQVKAGADGLLHIAAEVTGNADITYELTDEMGKNVAHGITSGEGKHSLTLAVDNVRLWTAETPSLYTLTATVAPTTKRGQIMTLNLPEPTEVLRQRVGFRTVEVRDGQLFVNGKAILIKGVDRHELDPDGGYIVSMERMVDDIKRLKEFNFNAVRTCHYPDNPRWYDLCDEMGIYVCAEANMESHGFGFRNKKAPSYTDAFATQILERNKHNVLQHFNHPSIITWSLGNETVDGPNFTAAYQWTKEADGTRPIQWHPTDEGPNTDIFCPMYMSQEDAVKYSANPEKAKPLIQCEYSHAMGNSSGGFKEYWDAIRKYPKYQGGYIWDFADQALRSDGMFKYGGDYDKADPSDNNFNCNGVFSPDRQPSPQAYEVRYQQQDIWTSTSDFWNDKTVTVRNEFFFKDLSNVMLHWELMHEGTLNQQGDIDLEQYSIQPQSTADVTIPCQLYDPDGEILLNVHYTLKDSEPLLPCGTEIAYQQFVLSQHQYDLYVEEETHYANREELVNVAKRAMKPLISEPMHVSELDLPWRPNFWRAMTDNDMGAGLHDRYKVWQDPLVKLVKRGEVTTKVKLEGRKQTVRIERMEYDMPEVKCGLVIDIIHYPDSVTDYSQTLMPYFTADDEVPNMLRFGVARALPQSAQSLTYYGRGPWENYSDRCSGASLAVYRQTVDEQFYPYIRPQDCGTKTDVRWLDIAGMRIYSDHPFSFQALNYSQEELDEMAYNDPSDPAGTTYKARGKHQRHPQQLRRADNVMLYLDLKEAGVGGINSWSQHAEALDPYRVKPEPMTLRLVFVNK